MNSWSFHHGFYVVDLHTFQCVTCICLDIHDIHVFHTYIIYLELDSQLFFLRCFNWMIPNLCIGMNKHRIFLTTFCLLLPRSWSFCSVSMPTCIHHIHPALLRARKKHHPWYPGDLTTWTSLAIIFWHPHASCWNFYIWFFVPARNSRDKNVAVESLLLRIHFFWWSSRFCLLRSLS